MIAWEANPQRVSLATPGEKKGVSPESTLDRMRAHFPAAEITSQLQTTLSSPEYRDWVAMRNALAHRTSPPRKHYLHLGSAVSTQPPSEWGNLTLDDKVTEQRREWLRGTVAALLGDAGRFASSQF